MPHSSIVWLLHCDKVFAGAKACKRRWKGENALVNEYKNQMQKRRNYWEKGGQKCNTKPLIIVLCMGASQWVSESVCILSVTYSGTILKMHNDIQEKKTKETTLNIFLTGMNLSVQAVITFKIQRRTWRLLKTLLLLNLFSFGLWQ